MIYTSNDRTNVTATMNTREYARQRFGTLLHDTSTGDALEQALYEFVERSLPNNNWDFFRFRFLYKTKLVTLISNLQNEKSNLQQQLRNGLPMTDLMLLPTSQFAPDMWKEIEFEETTASVEEGMLKCITCARNGVYAYNTTYEGRQTRSGDEATTIFALCKTCGKRWRFS